MGQALEEGGRESQEEQVVHIYLQTTSFHLRTHPTLIIFHPTADRAAEPSLSNSPQPPDWLHLLFRRAVEGLPLHDLLGGDQPGDHYPQLTILPGANVDRSEDKGGNDLSPVQKEHET